MYRTVEVTKDLKPESDDIEGSRDDSAKEEGTMPIQKLVVQPPLDGLDSDTILCMEVGDLICFGKSADLSQYLGWVFLNFCIDFKFLPHFETFTFWLW